MCLCVRVLLAADRPQSLSGTPTSSHSAESHQNSNLLGESGSQQTVKGYATDTYISKTVHEVSMAGWRLPLCRGDGREAVSLVDDEQQDEEYS